jgi:4-amino-4-deoxychorismate lyase
LHNLFELRGNCDDIIIVQNECLTDSYTANLVLYNGKNWITPDTPLLAGTQRARLLKEGKIFEGAVKIHDLPKYSKAGLINALNNLEEMPVIEIENIYR